MTGVLLGRGDFLARELTGRDRIITLDPGRHFAVVFVESGLVIGFSKPSERAYPAAIALLARVLRRSLAG